MTTTGEGGGASLTPNAVRKMIMGEPMDGTASSSGKDDDPWIVIVFHEQNYTNKKTAAAKTNVSSESTSYNTMTVWDGTDYAKAIVIGPLTTALLRSYRATTVAVYSYICSEANSKDNKPFLCIIPIAIVQEQGFSSLPSYLGPPLALPPGKKIKGGVAPVFFAGMAHLLSNHALSGHSSIITTVPLLPANAKIVADHLAKQAAMMTLACASSSASASNIVIFDVDNPTSNITSSNNNSSSNNNNNNNYAEMNNTTKYYMSALREFQESQLGRQNSSLTTNAGREDATRAALVVQQHDKALHQALLDVAEPLSTTLLCKWHAILCGEGVLLVNSNSNNGGGGGGESAAGVIRTKNVRVGNVHFRPHHVVRGDVDSLCQSINSLEQRLLHQSGAAGLRPQHASAAGAGAAASLHQSRAGVEAATFAACVLFGVLDVHAFCDGNGRLARIALNWALHKAGIPFVIHLFATPAQRKEYVDATVKTRRNLSLMGQGRGPQYYSQEDLVHAHEAAGALGPLVDLILDRLGKTIIEFEKLVLEKSRLVYEEEEARAAKAVRDRERAGTCLICFDDNPNIGTLCCGKAVHLNCVAQWLSQNNTCPNCREQFPALPPRMMAPPAGAAGGAEVEDTESTTGMEQDDDAADVDDTTTTFSDDDGGDTTTVQMDAPDANAQIMDAFMRLQAQQAAQQQQQQAAAQAQQPDDTAEDYTTADDTTVAIAAAATNNNMGDTDSTTESTTTTMVAPSRNDNNHLPPFCVMNVCSNRAARDCSNNTCGRCCISYGQYSCARHNN